MSPEKILADQFDGLPISDANLQRVAQWRLCGVAE